MSDDPDDHARPKRAPAAYAVGYRKPPVGARFQRGVSGNPRGRPKRPRQPTVFEEVLAETAVVRINGRDRKLTTERIIDIQIVSAAAKGDRHAQALYTRRQIARGRSPARPPEIASAPVVFAAVFPPGQDDGE